MFKKYLALAASILLLICPGAFAYSDNAATEKNIEIQDIIDNAEEKTTVVIPPGHYFISKTLEIYKSIDLRGSGDVTLDARGDCKILFVANPEAEVTMTDINFVNGFDANGCGAIENHANVMLSHCIFSNNRGKKGGAIENYGNLILEKDCKLSKNIGKLGGAIYNEGTLMISDANLQDNQAENGGAITNSEDGTVYVRENSIFLNNIASNQAEGGDTSCKGGAIFNRGKLDIEDAVFLQNIAEKHAGAIWNSGDLTINDSEFRKNVAYDGDGGAIRCAPDKSIPSYPTLHMDGVGIFENVALNDGGGMYCSDLEELWFGSGITEICANLAGKNGGGVYLKSDSYNDQTGVNDVLRGTELVEVHNNTAASGSGGGVFCRGSWWKTAGWYWKDSPKTAYNAPDNFYNSYDSVGMKNTLNKYIPAISV